MSYKKLADHIRSYYQTDGFIPLHAPFLSGKEAAATIQEINTGLYSSSSPTVAKFENLISNYLDAPYFLATNSGTSALHIALLCAGVQNNDLVITQPLSFVATANSIRYCGANPIFIDINPKTLSICPKALSVFLEQECEIMDEVTIHKSSKRKVSGCLLMHTLGIPGKINEISEILASHNISLIEDAAQAFGSIYQKQFCGTFGRFGCYSFNGNKTISTGGGGGITFQSENDYLKAKSLITQSKTPHPYQYSHSAVGYNYKMAGINAAIGCEQITYISQILSKKQALQEHYKSFFKDAFIENNWLNTILASSRKEAIEIIEFLNYENIECRPAWELLIDLPMYKTAISNSCPIARSIAPRLVSFPSGSLFKL